MTPQYLIPDEDRKAIEIFRMYLEGVKGRRQERIWAIVTKWTYYGVVALIYIIFLVITMAVRFQIHPMLIAIPLSGAITIAYTTISSVQARREYVDLIRETKDIRCVGVLLDWKDANEYGLKRVIADSCTQLLLNPQAARPYHFSDRAIKVLIHQMVDNNSIDVRLRYLRAQEYIGDSRVLSLLKEIQGSPNHRMFRAVSDIERLDIISEIRRIVPIIEAKTQLQREKQELLRPSHAETELLRPAGYTTTDPELLLRAEIGSHDD